MLYMARPLWTPKKVADEASVRVYSIVSMPTSRLLPAGSGSPYPSYGTPARPSPRNLSTSSRGNSPFAQAPLTNGCTSVRMKSRARRRSLRSSSGSRFS